MQMQDDDKIFKVLGDKLRDYEAGEASDADWAAFQAVYPAEKKKKRAFIWFLFPLLGVSFVLLAWYINLSFSEKPKTIQNNPNTVLSSPQSTNPIASSNSNDVSNTSSNKNDKVLNENSVANIESNQTINSKDNTKSNKQVLNPINTDIPLAKIENSIPPSKIEDRKTLVVDENLPPQKASTAAKIELPNPTKTKSVSVTKNENSSKDYTTPSTSENVLEGLKADVKIELKDTQTIPLTSSIVLIKNVDSLTINQIKKKDKSNVQLSVKHIDLSAMYSPAMSIFNNTLESNNLAGFGLGIALGIHKHWYVGSGLNYMFSKTESNIKKEVPHEYSTISKIDTTLKYDFTSSMIVMNMDTHYQKHVGIKIDENSIVRNLQVFSLPVIIGYSLGNQKTELSLFSGVQNDWLVEEYTTNNLATKATETFTNQKLLAAPLVGFGFSRKFYANWALNLGMDYRHYLSSSLDKKDYWRVQAGIRYHLK